MMFYAYFYTYVNNYVYIKMNQIIKWKTHCDDIGDFFRNPILIRIIKDWYKIKRSDDINVLKIYTQKKNKKFSPEFYEFIRSIFENRTEMNYFLDYLRETLLVNQEFIASLKWEYHTDDFVKILLAFDELNDQLSTITRLTVWSVFSTKIADILWAANIKASHFQDEDEQEIDYSLTQVQWLRRTIENWIMPISSDGEILLYVDQDDDKYIMSTLGNQNIVHVDRNGNRLDKSNSPLIIEVEPTVNKRELMKGLKDFEVFFTYLKATINWNDAIPEISEDAEALWINLTEQFITENKITQKELYTNQIHLTKFKKWLVAEYQKLEAAMEKMPIVDKTRINEWKEKWIRAKIHSDLPNYDLWQKIPQKWKPKLTVVKN